MELDVEFKAKDWARPDLWREHRKGVPEIVLAEGKRVEQVVAIVASFMEVSGRAIVSRARPKVVKALKERFSDCEVLVNELARTVVVRRSDGVAMTPLGKIGLITAGTADLPAAEEAKVIAQEMGCEVFAFYDVGVAGLHRLVHPLQQLSASGVDAIIVAAGMDAALPSVVAGLVDVPVIGLPTSTGYGLGGKGTAAILAMLQSCSPGLVVVNIDNGVGAGTTAAIIANRVAKARLQGQ